MNNRSEIVILFLALCAVLAVFVFTNTRPDAVLTKTEDDIDNTIIGDSATNDHSGDAPAYMNANYGFPMPLALWNPSTTVPN